MLQAKETPSAKKPSEAILVGIERFVNDQFKPAQNAIEKQSDDVQGRKIAVTVITKLMKEISNWLLFEELVNVADQFFVNVQSKSEEKHNLSLAHQILKL